MTTNLDIIKRAMKKIHVLGSGAEPTSQQAADGMDALRGLLVEVIGQGSLGRLRDVLVTADYTAREFDRIRCDNVYLVTEDGTIITDGSGNPIVTNSVKVTLPTTITPQMYAGYDDCCDYGRGGEYYDYPYCNGPRVPLDLAPVVVITTAGLEIASVYVANKGAWVTINGLAQQDTFPFASDMENGFAAMLAERIVDDFAQELPAQTAKQAVWARYALATKYSSPRRSSSSFASYM